MSTARLLLCLSLAACAARPAMTKAPATSAPRYELCKDPEFRCAPATRPMQVDTNIERHEQKSPVANSFRS